MEHKDRIALVTGATRGIGREVAKQIANQGVVVLLGCRDLEKGRELKQEIEKAQGRADVVQVEVDSEESIRRAKDFVLETYGKLDILVNNAGILKDTGDFLKTDLNVVKETFSINVLGALLLDQAFLPVMIQNDFGRIVHVSSGMGQLSDMNGGYTGYRISKASLNALTCILAAETKGKDIKINSVCPGWVQTDMGGPGASRTPEKGAETIVWAALLPKSGPTGKFFRDKKEIPW